jgi:hypothetical protein
MAALVTTYLALAALCLGWQDGTPVYQLNMPLQVGCVFVQYDRASNWIDLRGRCFVSLFSL